MDKRIFVTFLAIICLIGFILGIRWALKPKCEQPVLIITPQNPETGQEVVFATENGNVLVWEITGEKTARGASTKYTFNKSGTYIIKATAGEECVTTQQLIEHKPCEIQNVKPEIKLPSVIYTGRIETMSDITSGANSWKWSVEGNSQTSTAISFSVSFDKPGNYTVKLSLSGKCIKGDTAFVITVAKAPTEANRVVTVKEPLINPQKTVEKPTIHLINDPEFINNFVEIANQLYDGETSSTDWATKIVARCCDDARVEVFINGGLERDVKLSKFKQYQINNEFHVSSALVIEKGFGGCIKKIRAYVTKNN